MYSIMGKVSALWTYMATAIWAVVGYFTPIHSLLICTICFMFADFFLGLRVSYVKSRKNKKKCPGKGVTLLGRILYFFNFFDTAKAWKWVQRATFSIFMIIGAFQLEQMFGEAWGVYLSKAITFLLCIVCAISCLKNMYILTGWIGFKILGFAAQKKLDNKIETLTSEEYEQRIKE